MCLKEVRGARLREWFSDKTLPSDEKSYLSQLMSGTASFGEKAARRLEETYSMPSGYLDSPVSGSAQHEPNIDLPLYVEKVSDREGSICRFVEFSDAKLTFPLLTLHTAGVDPQAAVAAVVDGNSMVPLINDGATIVIDTHRTQIKDGKIYAINHRGMLRVKALYRMPGGGLRVRSVNTKEHPEEIYTAEQAAHEIDVLGWVFWWSHIAVW